MSEEEVIRRKATEPLGLQQRLSESPRPAYTPAESLLKCANGAALRGHLGIND